MSTQRLRAGAKYQNLAFGAAGDLVELGNNGLFSYNIGAFLRAGFVSFEQLLKGGE